MIRLFPMILALIAMYTCYRSYHLPRTVERRLSDHLPAVLGGMLATFQFISQLAWLAVIGIANETGGLLFLNILFSAYDSAVMIFLIFVSTRR
jgi:hypothetical protein